MQTKCDKPMPVIEYKTERELREAIGGRGDLLAPVAITWASFLAGFTLGFLVASMLFVVIKSAS